MVTSTDTTNNPLKLMELLRGNPTQITNTASNSSDKLFATASDKHWRIDSIFVKLTTTATAGDRQLQIDFTDGVPANVISQVVAGLVQAASLTRYYMFAPGLAQQTAFVDTDKVTCQLPLITLIAEYRIRIYDNNAVDAAADDMEVRMMLMALA